MIHIDDDKLLEYAVETLSDISIRAEIETHLASCGECRLRLEDIRKDIEMIGSVRPLKTSLTIPIVSARPKPAYRAIRVAALIVFGMAIGLGASSWIHKRPATVNPAYITLSPPPDSVSRYAAADVTGIARNLYDQ